MANLLRYAVSLNTAAGLVSPTRRRLATPTYGAVEIAALILEGRGFEEALEEAARTWTGSPQDDHRRALAVLRNGEDLRQTLSGRLSPEELAEHLEIPDYQFLELLTPDGATGETTPKPES